MAKKIIGAPNINHKWRRVMAVGCSHGVLGNDRIKRQILEFRDRYKPQIRFDLGDIADATAFRGSAKGTADEAERPEPDLEKASKWIYDYAPTHISWGNHDARVVELQRAPNAIIAYAASTMWEAMSDAARKVKAQTIEYDYQHGWFELGGCYWGHGFWYGESAVRDHAEYLGGSVVMAHLHAPQQVQGRTRKWSPSYCVGTLADIPAMGYARRRRATSRWGHGCVFGEMSDTASHLHLVACEEGEDLRFPL